MDFKEIWEKYGHYMVYAALLAIIAYLVYNIQFTDATPTVDGYFDFGAWHRQKWLQSPPPSIIINMKD